MTDSAYDCSWTLEQCRHLRFHLPKQECVSTGIAHVQCVGNPGKEGDAVVTGGGVVAVAEQPFPKQQPFSKGLQQMPLVITETAGLSS